MKNSRNLTCDKTPTRILLGALVVICLLQALVLLFYTAHTNTPSAKVIQSCVQDRYLRPKFPHSALDPCLRAPITHLQEA